MIICVCSFRTVYIGEEKYEIATRLMDSLKSFKSLKKYESINDKDIF